MCSTSKRRKDAPPATFFSDRNLGRNFPVVLRRAGFAIESHDEHFGPTTRDEEWIPDVAARGWVALTHDRRIRWRPNERAAVETSSLRLLVLVSKLPFPVLATHVADARDVIARFVLRHEQGPWIARFYPPTPREMESKVRPRGRVEMWEMD